MADLSPNRKRLAILIVVVGGALLAERVVALLADEAEVVEAAAKPRPRARPASAPSARAGAPTDGDARDLRLDRLDERERRLARATDAPIGGGAGSPFDSVAWQPPSAARSAVAAPAAPPPPPVAPPFPYAYIGGLTEDGVRTAFFNRADRVMTVRAGDTVDAVYRIDQMTDHQMTLTYLPLNETQVLALGTTP